MRAKLKTAWVYLVLTALAAVSLVPLYWMVISTFKTQASASAVPPEWWPGEWTLDNLRRVVHIPYIWRWILNSAVVAGSVTLGNVFFNSLAGFAFARLRFPGRDAIFWTLMASMMIPTVVTLAPLYIILTRLGWIDTYYALIVPGLCTVAGIFFMRQFMLTLPQDLLDAARLDGCSEFQIFWKIAVPVMKPAMAMLGVFAFVGNWNSLMWPLIVINSEEMKTLPVGLAGLQGLHDGTNATVIMGGAFLAAAPMFFVFFAFQRHFLTGVAMLARGKS